MKKKSKALQTFFKAAEAISNPAVQDWKKQGGKAVGYFCSNTPEEIITAAGFLPFRMRGTGSTSTELSDEYFCSINCSFPRHTLNQALKGEYDFLDGLVVLNSCDHVRRIYDNWKISPIGTPFLYMMNFPRMSFREQVDFHREELAIFIKKMEKHFKIEITNDHLKEAIRIHNMTRLLQRRLYELRKKKKPPITGAETLAVMVAGTAMPKFQYNELLTELLDDLKNIEGNGDYRARLMIVGSELDDPSFVKVIEDQGGLVVTDSSCFGTRLMWEDMDEDTKDPLGAIANYYVTQRPPCPRQYKTQPERIEYIRNMYKEFNVDGIILERLIFCDNWQVEAYLIDQDLKEDDIPFLHLDREYIPSAIGQLKTRVQAFIETMGR